MDFSTTVCLTDVKGKRFASRLMMAQQKMDTARDRPVFQGPVHQTRIGKYLAIKAKKTGSHIAYNDSKLIQM
jgi:hypothetical protein